MVLKEATWYKGAFNTVGNVNNLDKIRHGLIRKEMEREKYEAGIHK